jgi:hypothetical protein
MSKRIPAISTTPLNIGFNLDSQEQFIKDKGIVIEHWAAIPSPIGSKDRGDYRRPDALDTLSENGYLYKKVGEFVGIITGNSKKHNSVDGGMYDSSIARLVLPKFYNEGACSLSGKEIQLLPGDRLYASNIALNVPNYQKVEYHPNKLDILQFPVSCVIFLRDSRNVEYTPGFDFTIDDNGHVDWLTNGKNPGIDPETGRGRIYSIRYTYKAFWYVHTLVNEIRITNTGDASSPTRLPYHATIQREYVYHQKTKGDAINSNIPKVESNRTNEPPTEPTNPQQYDVKVEIKNFE